MKYFPRLARAGFLRKKHSQLDGKRRHCGTFHGHLNLRGLFRDACHPVIGRRLIRLDSVQNVRAALAYLIDSGTLAQARTTRATSSPAYVLRTFTQQASVGAVVEG